MRAPNFLRLAQIDEQRFITACRHGLVHLTWVRTTVRFTRDEFIRLAGLLERVTDTLPPASIRDGELRATYRAGDDSELRIGSVILLLAGREFDQFAQAVREAVHQLDRLLAAGVWDREEPDDSHPGVWDPTTRNPFSHN
jgi:hypothetical protein